MSFRAVEYIDELVAVGVPDAQAKVQAKTLEAVIDSELATKADLKLAIKELEAKLILRLGGMILASTTVTIAILGFLIKS